MTASPGVIIQAVSARFIRPAIAVALLVGAVVGLILFVQPPAPVLRWIVVATADPLLDGHTPNEGHVQSAAKRLLRGYVQASLAERIGDSAAEAGGNDVEILARMITSARRLVLSPSTPDETRYDPTFWPALVSGLGYCDQINGAVCLIAANHFEKPQLIALYDPVRHLSPHTVGRVWSKEHEDWLYFDAFFSVPVIYVRDGQGKVRFLMEGPTASLGRAVGARDLYDLSGWTLSEFSPSFIGYIFSRLPTGTRRPDVVVADRGQTSSQPLRPIVLDEKASAQPPPRMEHRQDDVYRRVSRAYVEARVEDLLGAPDPDAYLAIAKDEEAATDDRAAELAAVSQRLADGQ